MRSLQETCSLHLHSVTQPHNYGRVFSSTAPGLVMGVGTIGDRLLPYDECDTFLSTDAGLTWRMMDDGAKKYEFGDQGSLLLMVEDEEPTDEIKYSFDYGKTWCAPLFTPFFADILLKPHPSFSQVRVRPRRQAPRAPAHDRARLDLAQVYPPRDAHAALGQEGLQGRASRRRPHGL